MRFGIGERIVCQPGGAAGLVVKYDYFCAGYIVELENGSLVYAREEQAEEAGDGEEPA